MKSLKSILDKSKNFIIPFGKGNLETRFVQRSDDYFACYLSSHSGCKMGCKFCHLTQLNQTYFDHASIDDYMKQFNIVYDYYKSLDKPVKKIHINFMARGEPFANKTVINNYRELYNKLTEKTRGHLMKINLSTIMPNTIKYYDLYDVLDNYENTRIYYSLYSFNPLFRNKWIPNSLDPYLALEKLKKYELKTGNEIHIHFALIEGENDNINDIKSMSKILKSYNFTGKFNLVRYNSFNNSTGTESKNLYEIFHILSDAFDKKSKIIPRVGEDVYASCGMFIKDI